MERVVDEAIAALCAEVVAPCASMQELTVEYLKTRKQFGVTIGSFQALQHRAVDMFDLGRAGAQHGAVRHLMAARAGRSGTRAARCRRPRCRSAAPASMSAQEAIQLHGGIGMTMEYKVGHYFKRLTMIDLLFGTADEHLAKLARMGGLFGAAKAA